MSQAKATLIVDPTTGQQAEVIKIQPYQAKKTYLCPHCNCEIHPGTGHYVVVPEIDPHFRRHWHKSCLERQPTWRSG